MKKKDDKTYRELLRSTFNDFERWGGSRTAQWGAMAIYTAIVLVCTYFHEAWWDEYHAWNIVYHKSFLELIAFMRYEGHFCLWHLLFFPLVKWFGMDWHALNLVSVPLMLVAAWLLLFRLRFSFTGKLLVLLSAPFAFYFPVVARCYALIPPMLVGIAILYKNQQRPFLYCFLIGLLAHTHAYIEGVVAVLWGLFVYDYVWLIRRTDPQRAKRNAWAAAVTVLMVLLALAQVAAGFFDVAHGHEPIGLGKDTPGVWLQRFYIGYHINLFDALNDSVWHYFPKVDFLLTLFGYVAVIVLTFKVVSASKAGWARPACLLLGGIAWQVLFAVNIYGMHYQRLALPFFVIVMTLWMYGSEAHQLKYTLACLAVLWMLGTHSQRKNMEQFLTPYAARTDASFASQIHKHVPVEEPVLIEPSITSVLPHAVKNPWARLNANMRESITRGEISQCHVVMPTGMPLELNGCRAKIIYKDKNYTLYRVVCR